MKTDIFIPWHRVAHWYLYHIHISMEGIVGIVITSYDSLPSQTAVDKKHIHQWLEGFFKYALQRAGDAAKSRFASSPIRYVYQYGQPPEQGDSVSCGVYVLLNILVLRLGVHLNQRTYMPIKGETYVRSLFRSAILQAEKFGCSNLFESQAEEKIPRMRLRSQSRRGDVEVISP